MSRLRVDSGRCEGHAQCHFVDPELFPLDDDGFSAIGDGVEVPPDRAAVAREGVLACPMAALTLEP